MLRNGVVIMGFTYRKSKSLGNGTRLNIGKKSVGLSAGTKGARVSVNSKGRVGISLGIPGTNFRYRKIMNSKKKSGGLISAIVNLTWWLLVASVWICCMICIYFWKLMVFLLKKIIVLVKIIVEKFRQKENDKQ